MRKSGTEALNLNENEYEGLILRDATVPLVYGPAESRRFGYYIGVNPLGSVKICSMNCGYCDLGATELRLNKIKSNASFPSLTELEIELRTAILGGHNGSKRIDSILISGNGEPTLHPQLSELIDVIRGLRNASLPQAKIQILTNGANLDSRKVADALNKVDERILKIDAGNEAMFKKINSPLARTSLSSIISNAKGLSNFIAQSMFVGGSLDNTRASDLEDWIEVMGLLRPKIVHLHTISRVPHISGIVRLDEDALYTIAVKLERRTQIKSLIFP